MFCWLKVSLATNEYHSSSDLFIYWNLHVIIIDKRLPPRLSAPGEIRSEYEAELRRLKAERLLEEQKHMKETELLIKYDVLIFLL